MQVYMWRDIPSLSSRSSGVAFAIANSLEEAVSLIISYVKLQGDTDQDFWFDEEDMEKLRLELETYPYQVHTNPMGFALWNCW